MKIQPSNTESFSELLVLVRETLEICRKLKIQPITYGSLAYLYYTQEHQTEVNDLDFLVPEESFPQLLKKLNSIKGATFEQKPYHSIEIFKDGYEIDLDSIEHFLSSRSQETNPTIIDQVEFKILNLDSLISIFEEAVDFNLKTRGPKLDKYQAKLHKLNEVKKSQSA